MVPKELQKNILKAYHEDSGHLARDRLQEILRKRYFWDGMYTQASDWVKSCELCAKIKTAAPKRNGLLDPIIVKRPFELVGIDIAGPLPVTSSGHRYLLVCIDYFTNWVEAAVLTEMKASDVAKAFCRLIICRHGCPENIITDQGTSFVSRHMQDLCDSYAINTLESSAYHHQCNGKVERVIRFIKQTIAINASQTKAKWDEIVDQCVMTYNMSYSRSITDSPFYLLYGRDPTLPADLRMYANPASLRNIEVETRKNYQWAMSKTLKTAYQRLLQTRDEEQKRYKTYYDKSHKDIKFEQGDTVLVLFDVASKSFLMPRWEGPYRIVTQLDSVTYRVENEDRRLVRFQPRL